MPSAISKRLFCGTWNRFIGLGVGFSFVARQKRMIIAGRDHYPDLLFYHRKLKRLVALDLKLDTSAPGRQAQMELYLAWLRENEQPAGEEPPIGLILCAGKDDETIRLLDLEKGDIRVASYWTKLLPREAWRKSFTNVLIARSRLERRADDSGEPPGRFLCLQQPCRAGARCRAAKLARDSARAA